jgi:hypothetical protein
MNRRRVFELFFGRLDRKKKWFQWTDILVVGGVLLVIAWIAPVCHVDRIRTANAHKACANIVYVADKVCEYRSKHGRWPEDFDQLISSQLGDAEWFIDPWNQPITWQDSPDGLLIQLFDDLCRPTTTLPAPPDKDLYVYSIGANGIDEKGAGDDIPNWDPDQNFLHHESYTNEFPLGLWFRRLFAR